MSAYTHGYHYIAYIFIDNLNCSISLLLVCHHFPFSSAEFCQSTAFKNLSLPLQGNLQYFPPDRKREERSSYNFNEIRKSSWIKKINKKKQRWEICTVPSSMDILIFSELKNVLHLSDSFISRYFKTTVLFAWHKVIIPELHCYWRD